MQIKKTVDRKIHLAGIIGLLFFLLVFSGLAFYFYYRTEWIMVFPCIGILFLMYSIPALYIHLDYFAMDKSRELIVDYSANQLIIKEKDNYIILLDNQSISEIVLTGYPSKLSKVIKVPWSDYYYFKISLKNGNAVFLTSLILDRDEMPFKIKNKRDFFLPFLEK